MLIIFILRPWWDQRANEDLTVGGKLYFTTGDISILDNMCTMVLFFNKQLIEDNSLDDPYELVKNGTWTLDKLFAMSEKVANDLDGDQQMSIENDPVRSVLLLRKCSAARCGSAPERG